MGVCSRCKRELKHVSKYKTCENCRATLKNYRRFQKDKKNNNVSINEDNRLENVNDTLSVETYSRSINVYSSFNRICEEIYDKSLVSNLNVKCSIKLDKYSVPKLGNMDLYAGCNFKKQLQKSFEIQYVKPLLNVVSLSGLDFKLFSSTWKNSKLYLSYKCADDRSSWKRLNLAHHKVEVQSKNEELPLDKSYVVEESVLKKTLLNWIHDENKNPPLDSEKSIEPVTVTNASLNDLQYHGFACNSKLNFILDSEHLEFCFLFHHKLHNEETKWDKKDEEFVATNERECKIAQKDTHDIPATAKFQKLHKILDL